MGDFTNGSTFNWSSYGLEMPDNLKFDMSSINNTLSNTGLAGTIFTNNSPSTASNFSVSKAADNQSLNNAIGTPTLRYAENNDKFLKILEDNSAASLAAKNMTKSQLLDKKNTVGLNSFEAKALSDFEKADSFMGKYGETIGLIKDIGNLGMGIGNAIMGYKNYQEGKRQADRAYNFNKQLANLNIDLLNKRSENANTIASGIAGKQLNNQVKLDHIG